MKKIVHSQYAIIIDDILTSFSKVSTIISGEMNLAFNNSVGVQTLAEFS